MNDVPYLSSLAPVEAPVPGGRLRRACARLWHRMWLDEREAYLSKATDCADLERRLRAWDDRQAAGSGMPGWLRLG